VHIKALTAVEIAHIARIEKMSWAEVLIALREAGLDTMPGGGAETFSAAVREEIADKKLGGADYIGVHRTAHQLGIRTNCTMLYGHVETIATAWSTCRCCATCRTRPAASWRTSRSRITRTTTSSASARPQGHVATSGFDDLEPRHRAALPRQLRAHQEHWIMVTPFVTQIALHFGVNDIEGTVVREKIYHAVGRDHAAGDVAPDLLRSFAGPGRCRPSAIRSIRSCATSMDIERRRRPERRPNSRRPDGRLA
jgi:aminodeoxyfutalosine synthase